MADSNRDKTQPKQGTPPLLLCNPDGGLALSSVQGSSLLMPVIPQTEASLIPSDEFDKIAAEADSFVGQSPPKEPGPLSYFQPGAQVTTDIDNDPFANVRQPIATNSYPPMPFSSPAPPDISSTASQSHNAPLVGVPPTSQNFATPQSSMTPPPRGSSSTNMHRIQGPPRYAPPPMGTNSPSPALGHPDGSGVPSSIGLDTNPLPPPMAGGLPPPPTAGFTPNKPPTSMGISLSHGSMSTTELSLGSPQGLPVQGYYAPVVYHWFYSAHVELRQIWKPFSIADSQKLEEAFRSGAQDNLIISVQGGRYDVDLIERSRTAVYWDETASYVRRCSWFYKEDGESRFLPYDERFADKLEDEYRNAVTNNVWHKRLEFDGNETIVMHNPSVIVHYSASSQPDEWGTSQGDQARPRVVKRGTDEFENLDEGEPVVVDHLVFVVHGIGPTCDLRFRNIIECVDDMRDISIQMVQSHFKQHQDEGRIGRIEFLPVRWHDALHGDATGVDRMLKAITLPSIGKLRNFTNDVLLDILFYGSPAYCQKIADVVGGEMNRLHQLFLSRNPSFKGGVSVAGHSLGSLILFDLLAHQADQLNTNITSQPSAQIVSEREELQSREQFEIVQEETDSQEDNTETLEQLLDHLLLTDYLETFQKEKIDMDTLSMCEESDIKEMGIPMGPRKKLQSFIKLHKTRKERKKEAEEKRRREEMERKLKAEEEKRAADSAQQAAQSAATNDPLLREASCDSINFVKGLSGTGLPLITYPKLNFSPNNFFALGSPVAMFLTIRGVEYLGEEFTFPTCSGFFNIFHPFDPVAYRIEPLLTQLVPPKPFLMPHHKGRKRLHLELKESLTRMGADIKARVIDSVKRTWKTINDFALAHRTTPQQVMEQEVDSVISEMTKEEEDKIETGSMTSSVQEEDILLGQLNQGRRIDYVLQERPIESFNDYLFALGSHYSYWESEDTILMMLKETYALMGLAPVRQGQEGGSPFKHRLPPPPMASPPGSLLASPSHGLPSAQTSALNIASPSMTTTMGMTYAPVGHVAPPPVGSSMGMPPASGSWSATAPPVSQPSAGPIGPPPMSGFVRK